MIGEENLFQNVLASLRVRRGWTQKDAAAHIEEVGEGLNLRTYIKVETGNLPPSEKHLKLIATGFKLNQADADVLYQSAHRTPPRIHNLPFPRNPFFTGRETYMDKLGQLFRQNDSIALTQPVSISGLGGIGKTQLALEYAHQSYRTNVYQAVFWVDAADEQTLQASYVKLAHRLELPERDEQELPVIVQAVKDWLARHTNWLLIMDNADDLELARSFFPEAHQVPEAHQGRILLTTRSQIVGDVVATQIEIDKMEPAEGLLFLLRRTRKVQGDTTHDAVASDIREPATQLVELLDGHPLALDQAGAYILEAHVSIADYITLYDKTRRELLDTRWLLDDEHREHTELSYHPESVAVTFDLCFKQARARQPLAGDILDFCAFLSPDAMPEELFQHDGSFNYGTTVYNKAIAALLRYSLIKRNDLEKTLSMHRLVQAVLTDGMSHDIQKQWRAHVVYALNAAFPDKVEFSNWGQCERLLSHALVCTKWKEDELTRTVEAVLLFQKAGSYLHARGQYAEAEALLTRVLSIYKQYSGVDHYNAIDALTELASVYAEQRNHSQAEPLYRQALAITENLYGADHPTTASSLNNLAVLYTAQEKYEQAEPLLQQALAIREKHFGAEHLETAATLHNLAFLYFSQGKYKQGASYIGQALSIRLRQLGVEHLETARSILLLANLYVALGDYEQAVSLLQQALRIWVTLLGEDHPATARSLLGLARVVRGQGKHEQADALYQRALSIQKQRLGATHPDTQYTKDVYAEFLHSIGRYTEAAALAGNDLPSV